MKRNFLQLCAWIMVVLTFSSCNKDPYASFDYLIDYHDGYATVNFVNLSRNYDQHVWKFYDILGVTYDETTLTLPSVTYRVSGTYRVVLEVQNRKGVQSIVSKDITIDLASGGNGGGGGSSYTPTTMVPNKLVLTYWPPTDSSNGSWDTMSGDPDIFFKIVNKSTGQVLFTSSVYDDVPSSTPSLTWNISGVSLDVNTQYIIQLYDEDALRDEAMCGVYFKPSEFSYISTYGLIDTQDGKLKGRLHYTWTY